MTGEQAALTGIASATEHAAELRSRGDDPTPRGVVRAALAACIRMQHGEAVIGGLAGESNGSWLASRPGSTIRVLDVCAGYGCWASEMRRLAVAQGWPIHITGAEIHAPRESHLDK